jgi:hypothetical protein
MAEKSTYQPGGDGMTRGGLDRYLGPEARDSSSMSPRIEEAKTDPDEQSPELDCAGKDAEEAVCQIAKSEEEERERGSNAT